jgi:8-oxo-dGTP diphosphatase
MQDEQVLLAGCVLLDDYGRFLLLHRDLGTTGLWELPGGKVEEEELPEQAAVREIREELGVDVRLTKALGNDAFEYEGTTYMFYWFQGEIVRGEPEAVEAIHDDFDYIEFEDMPSMALSAGMEVLHNKILAGEVELTQ